MALILVKYKWGHLWLLALVCVISVDRQQSMWQSTNIDWSALPEGWPGRLSSLRCAIPGAVSWGSAGQRRREAAGEEGLARWWERGQRPFLAHRSPLTPYPSRWGRQDSLAFSPTSLPFRLHAALPPFVFPSGVYFMLMFASLHLNYKRKCLCSRGDTVFCLN